MKRLAALILSLLMLLSIAACGGGTSTENAADTGSNTAPAAGEPAAEETETETSDAAPTNLTVGLIGEPNTLHPLFSDGGITGTYECLFGYDSDNSLSMRLAEDYEWQDDNTLLIHLRKGVKFHEGGDFTADDVLYSIEQALTNPVMTLYVAAIDIENSEAVDDYTVLLKTHGYSSVLVHNMTRVWMMDKEWCEAGASDEMDQQCNGTGPYKLKEWKMGDRIILERNPDYWGDEAAFDTMNLVYFNDPSTAFMEFETGNLDVVEVQNAEDVMVMNNGAVEDGYLVSGLSHHVTLINMGQLTGDTFKNENLRQAIAHAIDVETMITSICGDMAIPTTSVIPSDDKNHIDLPYQYDPEAAKEYLEAYKEETGVDSVDIHMVVDNGGYNPEIAEAMQAYLQEIGINLTVETIMKFDLMPRMINGEIDFTLNSTGGGVDTNNLFFLLARGSGNPAAEFTDEEICQLIEDAQVSKDESERAELYKQIQQLIYDGAWAIPLYEPVRYYAARNGFEGVRNEPVSGERLDLNAIYYAG